MSTTKQNGQRRRIVGIAGAALLLTLFASQAQSQDTARRSLDEHAIRTIDASDLDLAQPSDAAILYRRIQRTATRMCRDAAIEWSVKQVKHRRQCVLSAVEGAVMRLDAPQLTILHRGEPERVAGW